MFLFSTFDEKICPIFVIYSILQYETVKSYIEALLALFGSPRLLFHYIWGTDAIRWVYQNFNQSRLAGAKHVFVSIFCVLMSLILCSCEG